ncbi:SDR family oxidoreductase [Streptomyces sp. NPDC048291]|uniref:SDR family oxidoreductase n=1 Tax=Streptomyces sp. NPDC048291 TaxID=3365530 RepID=UPI00371F3840
MDNPYASKRPDQRLAVVIGAGGMGAAVARRLSHAYQVLVADIDAERAKTLARELTDEGGDVEPIACDVTSTTSVDSLARAVADAGGFRVLAHVAGLSPAAENFKQILRVNLTGPALVTRALLPHATAGAAAILVSSLAGHGFTPAPAVAPLLTEPHDERTAERIEAETPPENRSGALAYQISKYGLLSLCRGEAGAWGERGARIVSLSPGLIATPMGAIEFEHSPTKRDLLTRTPLGRQGTMLEIADAVEFLASDRASFISGTDLLVDGGLAGTLIPTP